VHCLLHLHKIVLCLCQYATTDSTSQWQPACKSVLLYLCCTSVTLLESLSADVLFNFSSVLQLLQVQQLKAGSGSSSSGGSSKGGSKRSKKRWARKLQELPGWLLYR
jgi:hypothetical protein